MVLIIDTISMFAHILDLHYGTRLQSLYAAFVSYLESKARCIRPFLLRIERVAQIINLELDCCKGEPNHKSDGSFMWSVLAPSLASLCLRFVQHSELAVTTTCLSLCYQYITSANQDIQAAPLKDGQNLHGVLIWCRKKIKILK
jgi:hypothetical protein